MYAIKVYLISNFCPTVEVRYTPVLSDSTSSKKGLHNFPRDATDTDAKMNQK